MSQMADPMLALVDCQEAIDRGFDLKLSDLRNGYKIRFDQYENGERYFLVKVINQEVIALAILGLAEPINRIVTYSAGCAVKETHRGQGLALEAMNICIEEIKKVFKKRNQTEFYVEGVVDVNNQKSLNLVSKIISEPGLPIQDLESGNPCFFYKKLIKI